MATDALDPGPNGDYPYLDMSLQPTGIQATGRKDAAGNEIFIDVEATAPDGRRVSEIKPASKQ